MRTSISGSLTFGLCALALVAGCGSDGNDDSTANSEGTQGYADLTEQTQFELYPLKVDAATGAMSEVECSEHEGVFSVNEVALRASRFYRFCQADGTVLVNGVYQVAYGTPIHMARFRWVLRGDTRETTVFSYFADDDGDGVADTTRRRVECYSDPALGVVSTEQVFDAVPGQLVCVPPEYQDYFPVHYFFESLSPLALRLKLPDGSEHVMPMKEIPGTAEVTMPATPTCGLSNCAHLD